MKEQTRRGDELARMRRELPWVRIDTPYRLDFFASDACDASGSGEAQRFLGATTVVADAAGQAGDSTPATVAAGEQVTMTATRLTPAGATRETSEPSACVTVSRETLELSRRFGRHRGREQN